MGRRGEKVGEDKGRRTTLTEGIRDLNQLLQNPNSL